MSSRPRNRTVEGKTVFVTGGAGFIGSHLTDSLFRRGVNEVVVMDNLFVGRPDNLDDAASLGKLTFLRDDAEITTAVDAVFDRFDIDLVFNMATKALNYSFTNPANAFATNVNVVINLLEHQRRGRFESLCHFSTSEVYGTAVYEPMDEAHPKQPTTTYAAGKAAADLAVESYVNMFDLDACIIRPFNNYGPRQNHEPPLAGIIPLTASRILAGGSPELHGEGTQTRDFVFVEDTVKASLDVFKVLPAGETVNVSTNNEVSMAEVIRSICDHFGFEGEVIQRPARAADVACHHASNDRLRSLVPFTVTPFETGLATTLEWYRDRFSRRR
ncbi:MAG: NAD-dependent epimerase/dehydratase family protein [Acidimicrobiales bacterium]|nr:NAD-dependent epimerase/dehydratase family protein [Acidimicrobiales bacterium]